MAGRKMCWLLAIFVIVACNLLRVTASPAPPATRSAAPVVKIEPTAAVIVELPVAAVEIEGASYQAYQAPGDPFRFVCPVPCKTQPQLIYAQYAGFKRAREALLKITGVDTLAELQPVDIHVEDDSKCGKLSESPALSYAHYTPHGNAYV